MKAIIFLLLLSTAAAPQKPNASQNPTVSENPTVSQKSTASQNPTAPDSTLTDLLRQLTNHDEIDKDIAIKYLHLDSTSLQKNPAIHSDSSFSFGSHLFWIVSYAAVVNCSYKQLIEYNEGSQVFKNRLLIETDCDYDFSGDHTTQIKFRIKGNILYLYNNYYKIRNEDLVLDKKHSTYKTYRFPELTPISPSSPAPSDH